MGKKSQPKMPETASADEIIAAEADANRVNTYSPYGSQTYKQNADGSWNSYIAPNEQVQALIDRQMQMAAAAPSTFSSGGAPQGVQDRLAAKLGGMSAPQYNSTQFDAVALPENTPAPEATKPSVSLPRKPGAQAMGRIPSKDFR